MPTDHLDSSAMSPEATRFAQACLSLRNEGLLRKSAFRAENLPVDLLPNVAILDWAPPENLRVRLAGTALCTSYGRDITGLDVLELPSGLPPEHNRDALMQALRTPDLTAHLVSFQHGGMTVAYERLAHPLVDTEGTARWLAVWVRLRPGLTRPVFMGLVGED
ncbi:PAS domain-containing protein [Rhodocista pekingensis]|uniref:PAS domain-containing protein n=1 Tax=Rhodocista pekingensis TaxID=201185 RepID=A0ABW2KUW1_9PROT